LLSKEVYDRISPNRKMDENNSVNRISPNRPGVSFNNLNTQSPYSEN